MEKHHFLRLADKISGTTVLIALAVFLTGYLLHWSQPAQYSNGFFTAGAIVIVLGLFSVTGGLAQRSNFSILYAETAGQANIAERNKRTATDIMQRYGDMIFLLVTGLLLILIAVLIGQLYLPA
jgi:hypothetical protein